jgi:hypothetical protein
VLNSKRLIRWEEELIGNNLTDVILKLTMTMTMTMTMAMTTMLILTVCQY